MKNYSIIIFLLLCSSCENFWVKEDELEVNLDPLPVIHSYINPEDTLIRVTLNYAEPTVGFVPEDQEYFDPILNAEINISDHLNDAHFTYKNDYFHYANYVVHQDSFLIEEGKSYKITVRTPEGKSATCECTIPNSNVNDINLRKTGEGGGNLYAFEFIDTPGEKNYYAIAVAQYRWDDENAFERYVNLEIISDEIADEQKIFSKYHSMDQYNSRALLLEVDENYYKYHASLKEYYSLRDNPFAEPFTIFNNVEGGFGVMGCYTILMEVKL